MTTGIIYARVSSIGDRQSTERQVKDLSEYAKYKDIEVRKVFEEHISGARKNEERPDWGVMRLRFLPLSRNSLTVASTSIYKRSSLLYWTMMDIRPSSPQ